MKFRRNRDSRDTVWGSVVGQDGEQRAPETRQSPCGDQGPIGRAKGRRPQPPAFLLR